MYRWFVVLLSAAVIPAMVFTVNAGGNMVDETGQTRPKGINEDMLKKVAAKKIYFGHQSVGYNILDGVNDILKNEPGIKINMVKTSDPSAFSSAVFAHDNVGLNDDPLSKLVDFERKLKQGIGNSADIAFFKFCYVDIIRGTDTERIFSEYKSAMERFKKEYPRTTFVHVTVPLTVPTPPLKAFVKRLLGREENNINRNIFNDMLRKEYEGKEPLFDLAKVESTYTDGSRAVFKRGGASYFSLVPEYTDDGGHLGEKGRKVVALEFIRFLSSL